MHQQHTSTHTHKHTHTHIQHEKFDTESEFASSHPVYLLFEHSFMDAACEERCGEVAQIHHLLRHALLIILPKHHVLFLLLVLLRIAAVGLRAIAPGLGALSQHVEAFQDAADRRMGTTEAGDWGERRLRYWQLGDKVNIVTGCL